MSKQAIIEAEDFAANQAIEGLEDFDTEQIGEEWEDTQGSSDYIRWVQQSLNRILDLHLLVNGIMGPETRGAIRSFQQRQGLPAHGAVDSDTEQRLIVAVVSQPSPARNTTSIPEFNGTIVEDLEIPAGIPAKFWYRLPWIEGHPNDWGPPSTNNGWISVRTQSAVPAGFRVILPRMKKVRIAQSIPERDCLVVEHRISLSPPRAIYAIYVPIDYREEDFNFKNCGEPNPKCLDPGTFIGVTVASPHFAVLFKDEAGIGCNDFWPQSGIEPAPTPSNPSGRRGPRRQVTRIEMPEEPIRVEPSQRCPEPTGPLPSRAEIIRLLDQPPLDDVGIIEWLVRAAAIGENVPRIFEVFPELLQLLGLGTSAEAGISIGGLVLATLATFSEIILAWREGDELARYNGGVQGWAAAMASMAMRQPPCVIKGHIPTYTIPSLPPGVSGPDLEINRQAIRGWKEGARLARQAVLDIERRRPGAGSLFLLGLRHEFGTQENIASYLRHIRPYRLH